MKHIFLGRLSHWVLLVTLIALGWITGSGRLHVIHFNSFIIGTMVVTAISLILILKSADSTTRLTRDDFPPEDDG